MTKLPDPVQPYTTEQRTIDGETMALILYWQKKATGVEDLSTVFDFCILAARAKGLDEYFADQIAEEESAMVQQREQLEIQSITRVAEMQQELAALKESL